ncbi:polar amino acid transport system substrate-binding protein [Deinococcus metalli]|uniref:Amino acid ABC transporter substrate-binding protein n=1 Tax=Deinococcus metalli TaxID=1141878 RepID=A0A7W8KIW7_9DEIO|nr:transporter substrate-binding domain-containing protein [Deinococcus metalli]MBB5378008.1 polar amino acid transport system substrate-binding protein [Deinococcus metalli]GHF53750.1 amino acid ABC transporter substrate-binding protein [Deinococcus metalli]
MTSLTSSVRRAFLAALFSASVAHAEGTLNVGANVGNVPWEFQDASGATVGFEIELVNQIAKNLGKSVNVVNTPFNGLFAAVQSGRIDLAISSITITKKRLETVAFAQPYYDSDQSLTVKAGSPLKSMADFKGKTVGVDTGSTGAMWATTHLAEYGYTIREYVGLNAAMLDLKNGRIDGYISDIPALQYYAKTTGGVAVIQRLKTGEQYSIMFAKNNDLAKQFNAQIDMMKRSGYLAALHKKWFGAAPEKTTSTVTVLPMPK